MPQQTLQDIIKQEYARCATSPVYFMKKYCYIQHPIRGKILFELYPFQEQVLMDLMNNIYSIILKARQLGISTLTAGYALWLMIFHNDKNVLVLATTQDVAKNLVTKVKEMYDGMPSWLKRNAKTVENNKTSMRFENGSQIKAVSAAKQSARSEALSLLLIDEAAFIEYISEIWTAAQATLSTGGQCIALSTPNGMGNWFHRNYMEAEAGRGKFHPIKLHWTVNPQYTEEFRRQQDSLLGVRAAAQEFDCDFASSGDTVIDPDTLSFYEQTETYVKDPVDKQGIDQAYWLWEYVDYSKQYVVSVDVARGDGSDFSAFQVIEIATMTQVAEYEGKMDTRAFGRFVVSVATYWNNAMLVIENANLGWDVVQTAIEQNYMNLYYSYRNSDMIDATTYAAKGYDLKNNEDKVPGFTTSQKSRPLIISKMELYFNQRLVIIHSKRLINQLRVFVWKNGKPQASNGYNDDIVLSLAIGLWVRDTAIRLAVQGSEMTRSAINAISTSLNYYNNPGVMPRQNMKINQKVVHPYNGNTKRYNDIDDDLSWIYQ